MTDFRRIPEAVDISKPTPARMYDYMLRGKNYFDIDAMAAEQILSVAPEIRDAALSSRGFHQRAAKWMAEQGIRQFIDIGSGLPTAGNTHEVVKQVHPDARVVYVDNDPMVALQSEALLETGGTIAVIRADLREPEVLLGNKELRNLIAFDQPTGLLMTGVMMFIPDNSDPWGLVSRYVHELCPGSYLALSHLTDEHEPPSAAERFRAAVDSAIGHMYFRKQADVARFFDGLELVPPYPGARPELTLSGIWGTEDSALADSEGSGWLYSGVAKVP